jgi:NADPH2:quinone reductase
VVAAVGPGVTSPAVGQRVATLSSIRCARCAACLADNEADCMDTAMLGIHRWGGYADYVVVPAENTVPLPDGLSFAEATVIVRHVPTAHHLLVAKAGLRAGEWVLVMGAAGALGSSGIQVAGILGAHVIAGAGAYQRVQAAMGFGAEHGVNYRAADLTDEVMRITGGRGVDVVFENISDPDLWPRAFASLAPSGRLVTAGTHGGGVVTLDVRRLYRRRLRIIGGAGYNRADVEQALAWAAQRRIRAMPLREMPLREAAEAHRLTEAGDVLGKVVLNPTLN